MKFKLLLILILISTPLAYSQAEKEIYSWIIKEYATKNKPPNIDYSKGIILVVLEKPKYMHKPDATDFNRFNKKYKNLKLGTFKDFISKNLSSAPFDPPDINGIKFIIFNKDSIPSWPEISNKYPNWTFSILEFSKIGFNEAKNQAMVYYGFDSGPGAGGGIYLIFENKGRKWKYKKVIPSWAA